MRNVRLQGVIVGHREMFEAMTRAISVGKIKPIVSDTFAFADARRAFERMRSAAHFGKIVVESAG
jgi:D-arabinose 1-dehydrogenase-like Zn-dependent alcohol dehydrogenase